MKRDNFQGKFKSLFFHKKVSGLNLGLHRLYLRAQADNGQWGIPQTKFVLLQRTSSNDVLSNIVEIEYFFDNDPGVGNGYPFQFISDPSVIIDSNVPLDTLDLGNHTFYARAKNADGFWGIPQFHEFDVQPAPPTPLVFRVERATGDVYADGSFIPGGADLAERIQVSEPVEPGDVVELDPNKAEHYRKARGNSNLIAGVITTDPGFTLGNNLNKMESANVVAVKGDVQFKETLRPMLALMGRVPVKATTENGAIRPGDLLTLSIRPGYATRCLDIAACRDAIIGKALEGLEKEDGKILVFLMR